MIASPAKQIPTINPVQSSFSKAKSTYDEHSPVQQVTGKALVNTIDQCTFNNIIDIGCGTGLTTKLLYKRAQFNKFEALDFSNEFLSIAQIQNINNDIAFHCVDFDTFFIDKKDAYDLIFANMSLQWSNDLVTLLENTYRSLCVDGSLAFTIPLKGTFSELDRDFHINSFQDINTVIALLKYKGFSVKSATETCHILHFSSPLERLKSIKKTGACHFNGTRKVFDKSIFKQLRQASKLTNERYPLTYNIGLFYVSK